MSKAYKKIKEALGEHRVLNHYECRKWYIEHISVKNKVILLFDMNEDGAMTYIPTTDSNDLEEEIKAIKEYLTKGSPTRSNGPVKGD